jgi:hypothetical protein
VTFPSSNRPGTSLLPSCVAAIARFDVLERIHYSTASARLAAAQAVYIAYDIWRCAFFACRCWPRDELTMVEWWSGGVVLMLMLLHVDQSNAE